MGLPTTWVTLCLFHLFAIEKACKEEGWKRDRSCAIMGDDLVAMLPQRVVDKYEKIMLSLGARFSPGKHLVSKRYGVFCEEFFEVRPIVTKR